MAVTLLIEPPYGLRSESCPPTSYQLTPILARDCNRRRRKSGKARICSIVPGSERFSRHIDPGTSVIKVLTHPDFAWRRTLYETLKLKRLTKGNGLG